MKTGIIAQTAFAGLVLAAPLAAQKTPDRAMGAAAESLPPEDWGTPGAYHHALARIAGTWDVKITEEQPGETAREFYAEAVIQPTMGERYVEETLSGGPRDRLYRAHGVTGFNTLSGRVERVWFDNRTTEMRSFSGKMTLPGDEFILHGKTVDPMTRRPDDARTVLKILSDDEFVVTDFVTHDGHERRVEERVYTRK